MEQRSQADADVVTTPAKADKLKIFIQELHGCKEAKDFAQDLRSSFWHASVGARRIGTDHANRGDIGAGEWAGLRCGRRLSEPERTEADRAWAAKDRAKALPKTDRACSAASAFPAFARTSFRWR